MLFYLSSLPIAVLRSLDTEANRLYDRNHQMYDAALLTRCFTQHALRLFIDSVSNHIMHFIKIPFINSGIDFIDLPKGTSRQRSGKGAIRKRIPTPKTEVGKN